MMRPFDVVPGPAVARLLEDRTRVLDIVAQTYASHDRGDTENPDSYFLRFSDRPDSRIIALPARIRDDADVAGLKWIASFPSNVSAGLPRASAVLVLNDMRTGYPYALLEAAAISAARTAASAALALRAVSATHPTDGVMGIFGAGVIAAAVVRYLVAAEVPIEKLRVCDPDARSADQLIAVAAELGISAEVASPQEALVAGTVLTATSASVPHIDRQPDPGQVYLNLSLRDFTPGSLTDAHNIVDDVDHCLKANTSPHLLEQQLGNRSFITGTIAQLLVGNLDLEPGRGVVISPFGLGALDVAVGRWVHSEACRRAEAVTIPDFFGDLTR